MSSESRSNSESSRKRERDNEEGFKLPAPIRETGRERSFKKTLDKLKEKEKRCTKNRRTGKTDKTEEGRV